MLAEAEAQRHKYPPFIPYQYGRNSEWGQGVSCLHVILRFTYIAGLQTLACRGCKEHLPSIGGNNNLILE